MRLQDQLAEWDLKIGNARGNEVAAEISTLHAEDIPRDKRPQVANLARRVGLYRFALTLLREDFLVARENPKANEALISEYAATLTEVGAAQVAERLFETIPESGYEMTPFYRALLWMKIWRYDRVPEQIDAFKRVCRDGYRIQIADVNLVSALNILGRYDEAEMKLNELSRQDLTPMMKGILSEQQGQLLFFTNRRQEAREHFEKSLDVLKATNNPSAIYAEKWLLILELFESEERPKAWADFRERAERAGFWEVLRELDRYLALQFRDERLLQKLYFGTAARGYRELIRREFGFHAPTEFVFPENARTIFDTESGRLDVDGQTLKLPATVSRLLSGLSQDLYRPVAAGSLFEAVYPGEFFHPKFASQRIYKVIGCLREFSEKHALGLEIDATELGFRLVHKPGVFAFRYSEGDRKETASSFKAVVLPLIKTHFAARDFTPQELADLAHIPKRTVNRALAIEVENKTIESIGQGRGIRYRLKT